MTKTIGAGQTLTFSGALAADQTVTADGGTPSDPFGGVVEVTTRATNNGTIDLLAGGTGSAPTNLYGAKLQVTGTLTNTGAINLAGGAYGLAGDSLVIGAVLLDQGVVTNLGSIAVGGGMQGKPLHAISGVGAAVYVAGVLTNRGQISIAGSDGSRTFGGSMSISGKLFETGGTLLAQAGITGGNGGQIYLAGYLGNTASISIAGGYNAQGGTLSDRGLLVNAARLTINGPGSGAYTSAGTLNVEATGTLENNGVLTNNGSLTLDGSFGDYFGARPASYLASAGHLINADLLTIHGGYGQPYQGSIPPYSGGGATLSNTGLLTNTGLLVVDACRGPGTAGMLLDTGSLANSGTMTLYGGIAEYGSNPKGATVDVTGVLTNTGLLSIDGGTGTRDGYPGFSAVLVDTGVLTNSGTIALAGGQLTDSATLVNSGVISVAFTADGFTKGVAGLSLTSTGTLMESGTISGAGEVLNQGNIVAKDGADITVASLVNNGTIGVTANNALFIGSAITGTGTGGILGLQSAATLALAGSVQNQRVIFVGNNALLTLGDAAAFTGVLEELRASEIIDFLGLDITSAHASGTTLAIGEAGGTTLDFTLSAPLPAGTGLVLNADHHGGTDLLVQAPSG